jgi:hypothetical protein
MAADHLYLAAERAALTHRLGVRWGPVDERSGAAEIQGLDDRTLIERFSRRSEQIDQWLDTHGLSGIKASSAAAVATRAPKDYSESEESVYQRWTAELAEQGLGERQLAAVCSGGRGRPASRTELDAALDALAGPDGLTGQGVQLHPDGRGGRPGQAPPGRPLGCRGAHPGRGGRRPIPGRTGRAGRPRPPT